MKSERAKDKIQMYKENVRYQQPGTFFNLNVDDYVDLDKFRFEIFSMPNSTTELDIPVGIANKIAMWILAKSLPEYEIERLCKEYGFDFNLYKGLQHM